MIKDAHIGDHPAMNVAAYLDRRSVCLQIIDRERSLAGNNLIAALVLDAAHPMHIVSNRSTILGNKLLTFAQGQSVRNELAARLIDLHSLVLDLLKSGMHLERRVAFLRRQPYEHPPDSHVFLVDYQILPEKFTFRQAVLLVLVYVDLLRR